MAEHVSLGQVVQGSVVGSKDQESCPAARRGMRRQGHKNTVPTVVGVSEAGKPCDQILLPRFDLWVQLTGTGATP
jgi:hypothetical protein